MPRRRIWTSPRWLNYARSPRSSPEQRERPFAPMADVTDISPLARVMRHVDEVADGAPSPDTVRTGFPSVDKLLGGGARRGDLVVLGGDVSSGKSALALAMALRAAQGER